MSVEEIVREVVVSRAYGEHSSFMYIVRTSPEIDTSDISYFLLRLESPINGHYLIAQSTPSSPPLTHEKIIGVCHNKEEAHKKVYEHAIDYAKSLVIKHRRTIQPELIHLTGQGRERIQI